MIVEMLLDVSDIEHPLRVNFSASSQPEAAATAAKTPEATQKLQASAKETVEKAANASGDTQTSEEGVKGWSRRTMLAAFLRITTKKLQPLTLADSRVLDAGRAVANASHTPEAPPKSRHSKQSNCGNKFPKPPKPTFRPFLEYQQTSLRPPSDHLATMPRSFSEAHPKTRHRKQPEQTCRKPR